MLKWYLQTTESGNRPFLLSSASAGDRGPKQTVIDTENGTIGIQRPGLFQAFCYARKQKGTPYPQFEINRKVTNWRIEARKPRAMKKGRAKTATAAVGVKAAVWANGTLLSARRFTFTWAPAKTTTQRGQVLRLQQQPQQLEQELRPKLQLHEDKLRLPQHERQHENEKKECWSRRRANAPKNRTEKGKIKSIWVAGCQLRKCWIKTQARKNSGLGRFKDNSLALDDQNLLPLWSALQRMPRMTGMEKVSVSTLKLVLCSNRI